MALKETSSHAWSLFGFCLFTVTCASGLVYGWPSLRRNLVKEESSLSEASLGAIFTIGSWSTQAGRLFFGMARDRCLGTRKTTCLALLCVTAGSLGISLSDTENGAALGVSMFSVGLGSGAQLCLQPVAGLFPKRIQGSILASLSGAFQLSGLVFLALTAISSVRAKSFGGFAAGLAVLTGVSAFILPKDKFKPNNNESDACDTTSTQSEKELSIESIVQDSLVADEGNNNENNEIEMQENDKIEEASSTFVTVKTQPCDTNDSAKNDDNNMLVKEASVSGNEEDFTLSDNAALTPDEGAPSQKDDSAPTAIQQIWNCEYIALVVWFSVLIIPLQYYIATIGFQLERKGDDSGFYTGLFSIIYASCAVFAPLMGRIADVAGLGVGQAVSTGMVAMSLFTLAGDTSLNDQIFGMAFYGLGRLMTLSMLFTNVGKRG